MAFRQRTATFRPQLSVRRVYETLEPRSEMKETPEAYLQHVYLPGFTKDRIKITLEDSSRMLRVTGERPIQGNRWIRFDQTYPVPKDSDVGTLEGKFEGVTLILKLQKKLIPQDVPKQEVEPTQAKSPSQLSPSDKVVDEAKPEKVQETIPRQPTKAKLEEPNEEKKSDSLPSPRKGQANDFKTQKDALENTTSAQIPQETITNSNSTQKGQVEVEPKPTFTETTKTQTDEKPQKGQAEFEPKPTSTKTTKTQTDEKPQKGREEFVPKPASTKTTKTQTDEKPQKGQEEFDPKPTSTETTKTQTDEKPQKGREEFEPKPKVTTYTKEELKEKIAETSREEAEKERIAKVASESSKPVKDMEKGKEVESLPPKVQESEKDSCPRISPNQEAKSSGEGVIVGNGMRKLVASSSQLVTRMAEGKWNDQEKLLLENVGAAILVIAALGAYVSYRYAS